mmetsp:Transcript_25727/g.75996  ORF Transcript_25727/g.75996 Transcript_25727/m.75996 type:complete len:261 (+) Transcript_25727:77-859(+)
MMHEQYGARDGLALDWRAWHARCCGESDAVASAGHETFALLRPTCLLLRTARGAWPRGAWPPPQPPPTRPGRRIGRRLGHRRRRPQPHHLGLHAAAASARGCLRRRAPWLHSLVASAAERPLPRLSQPRAHRPALVPGHRLREGRVQVQRSVQRSVLRRRRSPILAARGACSTAALLRPARLFPLLPTAGLSTRSLPRGGFAPLCGTARLRAAALSFAFASSPSACSTASSASSTCASASFAAESAVPMSSTSAATISCK